MKPDCSIHALFPAAIERLQKAGCENPFLDAGLLIAQAIGKSREYVLGHKEYLLNEKESERLQWLLNRRFNREPMAHILGKREFYGLEFQVTKDVLDPRPDSETLIEAVLEHIQNPQHPYKLLDMGTGSGCLLLTLLYHLPLAKGIGVDIASKALSIARNNAKMLGLEPHSQFIQSDWFENINGRFDIIISNPPYIPKDDIAGLSPEVREYEPLRALTDGKDGLQVYELLAENLALFCSEGAMIALEIGQGQESEVIRLMESREFQLVESRRDLAGIIRCLLFKYNVYS